MVVPEVSVAWIPAARSSLACPPAAQSCLSVLAM
ncbi:Uncharacterised protein [Mycobacteroides abscessus subsp. abscessus]|nr:Uncharacterised protein [Mycobacteroides abscessus subsp. abscessus]